jgi:hypothetical protein
VRAAGEQAENVRFEAFRDQVVCRRNFIVDGNTSSQRAEVGRELALRRAHRIGCDLRQTSVIHLRLHPKLSRPRP